MMPISNAIAAILAFAVAAVAVFLGLLWFLSPSSPPLPPLKIYLDSAAWLMAKRRKRGPRVPEALLRVYGSLVQTLEAAILSLLPPPPACLSECACGGSRCLGCCSSDFLLRKDDPPDYRMLLTQGFCVVSRDAPPPPGVFINDNIPQRTVVRNLMVLIADDVHNHINVLQTDYKKEIHYSSTGEFLCTPMWELLLSRIGSQLMMFLLRFSSVFVPVQGKSHYQITGHQMDNVFKRSKISNLTSLSSNQKIFESVHTMVHLSNKPKRKRDCINGRSCVKAATFHDLDCSSNHFSIKDGRESSPTYFRRVKGRTNNILFDAEQLSMRVACATGSSQKMSPDGKPVVQDYHRVHLENVKLPCTEHEYGQIGSVSTNCYSKSSEVCSSKGSKRHRRLFSWQRRRKKNVPEKKISGEREKESLKMELLELDCNYHQPLQQPDTLLESTGVGALEDSKVSSSETIGEMSSKNCQVELIHRNSSNQPEYLGMSPHVKAMCNNQMTPNLLQKDFGCSNSKKIGPMCFYCVMMLSPQKVETKDQIKRSGIFYNTHLPYSVFPRNHILNSLKPNNSGAIQLMKHIFGFPDVCKNFLTCNFGGCSMNSHCLYHTLLRLLKSLIRNAGRCQRNAVLNKHCIQTTKVFHDNINKKFESFKQTPVTKMKKGKQSPHEVPVVPNFAPSSCPSVKADTQSSSVMMFQETAVSQEASFHLPNAHEKFQLSDLHHGIKDPDFELIESYSKHQHVVSFIWAVCRSIVPISLLGNSSSWRSLQKIISKFVKLHRFDNFHLKECVHGVKISCYPFLSAVKSSYCFCDNESKSVSNKRITRTAMKAGRAKSILRSNLFLRWIYWFFSEMVVPIITANFYVTDRECRKHELFYYPKPIWRKLVQKTVSSLEGKKFKLLDEASVRHILSGRSFGFSKARFFPKDKCLRLLALHRAPSVLYFSTHDSYSGSFCRGVKQKAKHQKYSSRGEVPVQYQSVNSALEDVYAILRSVKVEKPEMLGSSVFDNNDVHQKIHQFLSNIKSRSSEMPEIFIVVADVSKAFDSIDHEKLIGILPNFFEKEYVLSKHAKLSCWNKCVKLFYDCIVCKSNTRTSFFSPFQIYQSSNIIINKGNFLKIRKEELLLLLQEHLKRSIFKIGRCFYLQKVGISQGSALSTLLCSYYFGHMEKTLILPHLENNSKVSSEHASNTCNAELNFKDELPNITDLGKENFHLIDHNASEVYPLVVNTEGSIAGDNLLLRLIDDFLFISTSKEQATRFIVELKKGLKLYNCVMNEKKSGANFDMIENDSLINRVYTGADGISFLPWSGLLVNCQTVEIQADYTRYCGINIRSSVTMKMDSKPCYNLKKKLFGIVRIRCHPIFYDSCINSPAIVSLNAYQSFLLCAMKLHCCVCNMKSVTKLKASYLLTIIERSFSYMFKHIKKLMHGMFRRFGIRPSLSLQKREIVWLGLSAYTCVLKKKHSQYQKLLSLLRSRIAQYGSFADSLSHLRYAVDESHSSCFAKIKF